MPCLAVLASACGRLDFALVEPSDASGDTGDAALADTTTDGVLPYVCPPQFAMCDTFDSAILDPRWTTTGTVSRDTTIAHRGPSSLRFSMTATPAATMNGTFIYNTDILPPTATELWMRGWFRISALPLSTNALELMTVEQTSGLGNYVFLRNDDTELYAQFEMQGNGGSAAVPINTWFCLVWHVVFATTSTGSMTLTGDQTPTVSITSVQTQGTTPIDYLSIGPFFAPNNADVMQPAFDVWVDELIVGFTQAPTCVD